VKVVNRNYINELNDIIVELPTFRELKNKDAIHNLLNIFMEDLYIKTPQELTDAFNFELNKRMEETLYINYGVDKSYYDELRGNIKHDLAFSLEGLFQNKGSNVIFKTYADLFENIFKKINFYNVVVEKRTQPTSTGSETLYEYKLKPIYLSEPKYVIRDPQVPIHKKRKYIMELQNFKDYTVWPVPTNLVYIQFCIGTEYIDNYSVFLNGVRSYSNTFLRNLGKEGGLEENWFEYRSTRLQEYDEQGLMVPSSDNLNTGDIEFLLNYFRIEMIIKQYPDWQPSSLSNELIGSYLAFYNNEHPWEIDKADFIQSVEILLKDYGRANYSKRKNSIIKEKDHYDIASRSWVYRDIPVSGMDDLRRRWQFFLRKQQINAADETSLSKLISIEEIRNLVKERYLYLYEDFQFFLHSEDSGPLFDFYVQIYSIFYNGLKSSELIYSYESNLNEHGIFVKNPKSIYEGPIEYDWVYNYVDVLFGINIFLTKEFFEDYFDPVMELFIRYFFPVEMEFIEDLVNKVRVKNKWNSISTTEEFKLKIISRQTSFALINIGLDWRAFWINTKRHSHAKVIDKPRTICGLFKKEQLSIIEGTKNTLVTSRRTDYVDVFSDVNKVEVI